MRKVLKWLLISLVIILILAAGIYSVLRFGYGMDILDRVPAMTDGRVHVGYGTLYNIAEKLVNKVIRSYKSQRLLGACI